MRSAPVAKGWEPRQGGAERTGAAEVARLIDWDRLLERPAVPIEHETLSAAFGGRRVLIAGAAGSLGRELTACVASYGPAALTLVDHHEAGLFALREGLLATHPQVQPCFRLADARGRRKIAAIFAAERPEIVYHLAAYKHVPWGEEDPVEYIEANLGGARIVADAAVRTGVERLVYPSTDKAVNPPSLYGATKRIVEAHLRETAARSGLRVTIARFVNVLGSQGSAGPTFARQIAAGQPLTVTDPAMTRYWIAPHHATVLLAYAAGPAFGDPYTVLLPDALPAVPILTIARRVWQLLRLEGGEPPTVVTGLRPGERLEEELAGAGEWLERSPYPGVLRVRDARRGTPPGTPVAHGIDDLLAAVARGDDEAGLKARVLAWAHSFASA